MPRATPVASGRGRVNPVTQPLDHFNDTLVLNAWMIAQFGFDALPADHARPMRTLAHGVERIEEGLGADGLHRFYHAFKAGLPARSAVQADALLRYEENIVALTARLNAGRSRKFAWKYFQWLTLLFAEHYLHRYFQDRYVLLDELNAFVGEFNAWRTKRGHAGTVAPFTLQELNKVCLQNATGSGKTLLMHANLLQFRHHASSANRLADYSRALLLTPGEDLTAQHLRELDESGIRAQRFVADLLANASADLATVDALEIHKLGEKDGEKTIALRNFGDANLLLVDEGHIGLAGNDETGFMARRDALSGRGFVFEYSATFAQAVKAAKNEAVTQAYAKSVLFDYSYRYFYEDGYGKDYQVFNLADSRFDAWHTERLYMTAGLLSFYQQLRVYEEQRSALAEFNLEKPLWVFVGASVTKASGGKKEEEETATDVRNIVQFIADFLHDWQQSETDIQRVLEGAVQDGNGSNLFEHTFGYLQGKRRSGETSAQMHQDVLARLFGGGGGLRLTRASGETAEIRLHTGNAAKPFGLVNVGDAPGLMKELEKCQHVAHDESQFMAGALFGGISQSDSPVNVLIGSRKFIAGWDCWRVSTLGLMNIGKSEGSQIIQLFGRGVRLKGRDWSLKRSSKLAHVSPPAHIQIVETLGVFGVKANYMEQFRQMLEDEGLPGNQRRAEKIIPMNVVHDFGKRLMVLAPKTKRANGRPYDFELDAAVPVLNASVPGKLKQNPVRVDCRPRFQAMAAGAAQAAAVAPAPVYLNDAQLVFVNWDAVWLELERYKRLRGFTRLVIDRTSLPVLFDGNHHGWYELLVPEEQLKMRWENVAIWKRVVLELLKRYIEAFYRYHEQAFFEPRLELQELTRDHPNLREREYLLSWETQAQPDQDQVLKDLEALENEIGQLLKNVGVQKNEIGQPRRSILVSGNVAKIEAAVCGVQLLKPLLHLQGGSKITVIPQPLNDSEFGFVRDLNVYLETHPAILNGAEVFLLRNKSRGGGVGFFEAGAFYPDFIVWVLRGGRQYVAFVEPHGLRNESPHTPKLKFYATIKEVEARVNQGRAAPIVLDSFIASPTPMHDLKWGGGWQTLDEFGKRHVLMMKDDPEYVVRMFGMLLLA